MSKKESGKVDPTTDQGECCPHDTPASEGKKNSPWPSPAEAAELLLKFAEGVKKSGVEVFKDYQSKRATSNETTNESQPKKDDHN